MRNLATSRPAETAGAAGGLAGLVLAILTANPVAAAVALSGIAPAVVTYLGTHGGLRGVARSLWRGRA